MKKSSPHDRAGARNFYNVQHSPIGAFASFTLGYPGAKGGFGLELGRPANESVYIGLESRDGSCFEALPFFKDSEDPTRLFDQNARIEKSDLLHPFRAEEIMRELGMASDCWRAGDLTFSLYSPRHGVPDPAKASPAAMKKVVLPAVYAELTIDNTKGSRPREAFFGYQGGDPYDAMRKFTGPKGCTGIGQGTFTAIATRDRNVRAVQAFTIEKLLRPTVTHNGEFGLGIVTALFATVPAGRKQTFRFALCFYRDGVTTAGVSSSYYYTRYFKDIEQVAEAALDGLPEALREARKADEKLRRSGLSTDQQWMLAHAVHSYYGSTQFLECGGKPFWVVNEGEYRMMNTFDLTVDQLFFEMKRNPWTVRNELDWFSKRFSYRDTVRLPGEPKEYPGGLSFTHDMGVANVVSKVGWSAYERPGMHGCGSHMTHEELVNWVLCALVYAGKSQDHAWVRANLKRFAECLRSMVNRDHFDEEKRDGVMSLDSSRCEGGTEITTYDSLDASLGQSRNNLYLAVKCWAAYVGLEDLFRRKKLSAESALAGRQAGLCAATVAGALREDGYIPAVFGEGVESRVIPAIEGLVFPHLLGMREVLSETGPYRTFLQALRTHISTVLVPGVCLFEDGGFKLSSSSENSWLSKIYLCQYVLREVLQIKDEKLHARADAAHVSWLLHPKESYWAWSDQIIAGVPRGSKYYPRGVTSILWLEESRPIGARRGSRAK
jgi:hypothetical protein